VATLVLTLVLFALCMVGLGIGVLLQGRLLSRSCGADIVDARGESVACGVCAKKEQEICPSDDNLVKLAQIAYPKPRPPHHVD
jgi:hypothetical protein